MIVLRDKNRSINPRRITEEVMDTCMAGKANSLRAAKVPGRLVIFLVLTFITACSSASVTVTPEAWVVDADDTEIFILGTIHSGTEDMHQLPEVIDERIISSDVVIIESNLTEIDAQAWSNYNDDIHEVWNTTGRYAPNEPRMQYPGELHNALSAFFGETSLNESFLDFKPWTLYMLVQLDPRSGKKSSLESEYGTEVYVLEGADTNDVPVIGLEGVDDLFMRQTSIIERSPSEMKHSSVVSLYTQLGLLSNSIDFELADMWKQGDLESFDVDYTELLPEYFDDEAKSTEYKAEQELYERVFISERNERWVEQIVEYIEVYDHIFLAVGTAHLWGNDGVIQRFSDRGYTVKRVEY